MLVKRHVRRLATNMHDPPARRIGSTSLSLEIQARKGLAGQCRPVQVNHVMAQGVLGRRLRQGTEVDVTGAVDEKRGEGRVRGGDGIEGVLY